jgi:hypothetical protein
LEEWDKTHHEDAKVYALQYGVDADGEINHQDLDYIWRVLKSGGEPGDPAATGAGSSSAAAAAARATTGGTGAAGSSASAGAGPSTTRVTDDRSTVDTTDALFCLPINPAGVRIRKIDDDDLETTGSLCREKDFNLGIQVAEGKKRSFVDKTAGGRAPGGDGDDDDDEAQHPDVETLEKDMTSSDKGIRAKAAERLRHTAGTFW